MSPTEYSKLVREHCRKWQKIALSTVPADRQEVELHIETFYREQLQLEPPKCFWIESPRQAYRYKCRRRINQTFFEYDRNVNDKIGAIVKAAGKLAADIDQGLGEKQWVRIGREIDVIVHPLSVSGTWGFWAWRDVPDQGKVSRAGFGRCAIIDFFATKIGSKEFRPLKPWILAVAGCNGMWIYEGAMRLIDTPELLEIDDLGRLHSDTGPAVRFRNGTEYHFLHGVMVPARYVLAGPQEISLSKVVSEPNAEVRLALIAKVGFERLLGTVRHWTISEANGNRLIEFRVKGNQFLRFLHLRWHDKIGEKETLIPVPTRRSDFGRDVPEDIDDCEQVRRWTLGWPKEAIAVAET